MDPIAFHIGSLEVRWYGVCVALGFLAAYRLAMHRAPRYALPKDGVGDLLFAAMIGGIAGARLLYVVQFWDDEFSAGRWLQALQVYRGGLVFYGGFIGAALCIVWLARRRKWSLTAVGDLLAPCLPLGHALGHIGWLLNGCCFGRVYHGPAQMTYPGTVGEHLSTVLYTQRLQALVAKDALVCEPVFPIQALSALMNVTLALVLIRLSRRSDLRGRLFALYLILFGIGRFILEFGRGDYLEKTAGLTPAQIICLVIVPAGCLWFYAKPLRERNSRATPGEPGKA